MTEKEGLITSSIQCEGEFVYFIESRPNESGRSVLMRLDSVGNTNEVLPNEFNVRSRYLEYGGKSFLVYKGTIYFTQFNDQQIYIAKPGQPPYRLTNEKDSRFADFCFDEKRNRLICVREVLMRPENKNSICEVDLETGKVNDLVFGSDFYKCARVYEDQIFWISYNHPNMPWNGTELWLADIKNLGKAVKIAGDLEHSVAQAQWSNDGGIYFAAEMNNFINLYFFRNGQMNAIFPIEGEFIFPDWVPGSQQYAISNNTICAAYMEMGHWKIVIGTDNQFQIISTSFASVSAIHCFNNRFVAVVGHTNKLPSIIAIDTDGGTDLLFSSKQQELPIEFISLPQEIQYFTVDDCLGYAWYYAPKNKNYIGPEFEKPPLVTFAHGGPTGMSTAELRKAIQFWTSRGYAVVDVNYGGSTGYGRKYRDRLRGKWGLIDVSDCVAAVKELVARGLVDSKRVAICGRSAGGFTTLSALTFTKNIFSVGASYFGVSDLEMLVKDTHKLESRYLDQLVGTYPEDIEVYYARSPIKHVEQLNCPIIFFQGDEDRVVPPNQSQLMYSSLKNKDIPTEYHLYNNEGHGFRRAETIQHSLKAEHAFYARFFNFTVQPEDICFDHHTSHISG